MAQRRLLAVLAHPDDESFGPGGTLAKYAAEGVDVHIAICTDGAAGSVTEEFEEARERLAEIRCEELKAAVKVLGGQLHMLGFRDSGYIGDDANNHPEAFVNVDDDTATARVVELIRNVRPQVVITHDETGGYFHPDHIKAHEVTLAAFHAAGNQEAFDGVGQAPYSPQALYYTAIPSRWLSVFRLIIRLRGQDPTRMGRNNDIDFTQLGTPMNQLHAHINTFEMYETKRQASAEHRSQGGGGGGWGSWMPRWLQRRVFSKEYFIRGYPEAEDGLRVSDLFAGIEVR